MTNPVKLCLSQSIFDSLSKRAFGKAKQVVVVREHLASLLIDHSAIIRRLNDAGIPTKEP